jgi:hypothetical protein
VFDFGIAKALSLSRKVTRNDFGSIAYLSPERLESGEIDAQAEFWAVGVLLYEMISGVQPFRAADTRRLEQRIRARQPPLALDGGCPAGLQAIVAKLLAANVADRYASAGAIRDDLERFAAGGEYWRSARAGAMTSPRPDARTAPPRPTPSRVVARWQATKRSRAARCANQRGQRASRGPPNVSQPRARLVRRVLTVLAIVVVLNEIRIYIAAGALAENVPQDMGGVVQMWNQHRALHGGLNLGVIPLDRALTRQSLLLAERTFMRYRTAGATVYEREWRLAGEALGFAVRADPSSSPLKAALRYCDGHLRRIEGEARSRESRHRRRRKH